MNQYKHCCTCKETKSINDFGKNRSKKDGLHPQCNICRAKYRKQTQDSANNYLNEWRAKNPEQNYQHRIIDRIKKFSYDAQNYSMDVPLDVIAKLMSSDCAICGSSKNRTIDHIISLVDGGRHTASNLQPLCLSCNIKKYHKEKPH